MEWLNDIPACGAPLDEGAVVQIKNCRRFVERAALMADHHKGYGVPIGGVIASQELISPTAVGFDIGCGNKAILTDAVADDVRKNIKKIMDDIASKISFGLGRTANWNIDHALFDSETWKLHALSPLKEMARQQLGTVGGGNHYVDIFADEKDRVWVGCHFGSRGLGHKSASFFLDQAGAKSDHMDSDPVFLREKTDLGADYIAAMQLAGEYAYAGRDAVCDKVLEILGAKEKMAIHNHHNFAWKERHGGLDYWVMRKGATPAFPGQRGFVGATMGETSVILEGVESQQSQELLYSTVHGAGRLMSRTQAKGKTNRKTGEIISPGQISREMMQMATKGVELRGGDLDEAPQAYKRLNEVLEHQGKTVRVLHRLKPLGVAMAGPDIFDPFKD